MSSADSNTKRSGAGAQPGFLARLRRDEAGNVLAIMAVALVPMLVLGGSAIDYTRMVTVKTRLQQACDAGVLAGRKFLAAGAGTTIDTAAAAQAQNFFNSNIKSGFFQATNVTFTPTKTTDSQVAGTARATVPMLIMDMLRITPKTINVSCQARYDVADIDVVFVLDVTGSMACLATDSTADCRNYAGNTNNLTQDSSGRWMTKEKTGSRLSAMKQAVKDFYTELAAGADSSTHIRIGFVPYSVSVNFGDQMPAAYMRSTADYQSRTYADKLGAATTETVVADLNTCNGYATPRSPAVGYPANKITVVHPGGNSKSCKKTTTPISVEYTYRSRDIAIPAGFLAGNAVADPTKPPSTSGVAVTTRWGGCVEERGTTPYYTGLTPSSSTPPLDLDPDTLADTEVRRFRPYWPDVIYWRDNAANEVTTTSKAPAALYGSASYPLVHYHMQACPAKIRRLTEVTSASAVSSYIDSTTSPLLAHGMTYHDIGMVWGLRLISPTGLFKTDTAAWPGRNPPNRFIVFLTDGDMENSASAYTSHGWEFRDNRTAPVNASDADIKARHNARFAAACDLATDVKGIKVFVVAYAQTLTTELTNCASPGKAFYAANDSQLRTQFREIAKQVAMLRLDR